MVSQKVFSPVIARIEAVARRIRSKPGAFPLELRSIIPDITETEIPRCARNRLRNLLISSSNSQ